MHDHLATGIVRSLARELHFLRGKCRAGLAAGSDPIRPPRPGSDPAGVVTFRDLYDVEAMAAAAA